MSPRRRVVLLTVPLATVLTLGAGCVDGNRGTAAANQVTQRAVTTLLPQIVQQGADPASAEAAKIQGSVRFSPARKGRPVIVQRRLGTGSWAKVKSTKQNGSGVVTFTGPARKGTKAYSYRAYATAQGGLAKVVSPAQRTDVWDTNFLDEFSGSALDASRWALRGTDYDYASKRKCSKADPRAVSVGSGTLGLRVMLDPDKAGVRCHTTADGAAGQFKELNLPYYLAGHVYSPAPTSPRGVFAARIKFPKSQGQHGSFWLQAVPNDTTKGAEIDVVEYFGAGRNDGGLAHFVYPEATGEKIGGIFSSTTKQLSSRDDWWKSFHVFSVEWTPTKYVFRVDGRVSFQTTKGRSSEPVNLILSQLGSDWELPKFDADAKPNSMRVDWVRVWKK